VVRALVRNRGTLGKGPGFIALAVALAMGVAVGCGAAQPAQPAQPATWRAAVQTSVVKTTTGQGQRVILDVVLTPSATIADERAVVYGPPGLRLAGVGLPAGTASLLPGASAQPPTGWVILTQGGAGGRTDPSHPLHLHNEFDLTGTAGQDQRSLQGMLSQVRIALVWGDHAVNSVMLQWFYNGGRSPQPPKRSSFSS